MTRILRCSQVVVLATALASLMLCSTVEACWWSNCQPQCGCDQVTCACDLGVSASPTTICEDDGTSGILATLSKGGILVSGESVSFAASAGSCSPTSRTTVAGFASSTYIPGNYCGSATITATHSGCSNNSTANCNVTVRKMSIAASVTELLIGCGYDAGTMVTLSGACSGSTEPDWSVTSPLVKGAHGAGGGDWKLQVTPSAPSSGCQQTGTVTAQIGDCEKSINIRVTAVGPFSSTGPIGPTTRIYGGQTTFGQEFGEDVPPGLSPSDPVYGIHDAYDFVIVNDGCLVPVPLSVSETFYVATGCSDGQTIRGRTTPRANWSTYEITDRYGPVSNVDGNFSTSAVKCGVKQLYKVGECEARRQCVLFTYHSSDGTAAGLTISSSVSSNYDGCSCQ